LFYGRAEGHPYMITRALPGIPLRDFLRAPSADADARRLRRAVLRRLGTEVGRLHAAGFSHGDLRAGNVLIDTSEPAQVQIGFLDNEGTERHRQLPEYWVIKNLAQLNMEGPARATRTDRLRVFQAYCQQRGLSRATQRRLLGEIMERTRRRLDENAAAREAD
jgi:tRNA A-37 threonylcarbamoyl transferase component Bud32